jgi:HSP20 family protein
MAMERWKPRRSLARARAEAPFTPLARLERHIDDMFDRFWRDFPSFSSMSTEGQTWAPAVDVIDRNDEVVVRADLPGMEQKDVNVEIQDGMLSLRGERTEEREEKDGDYYASERWAGSFYRNIALPPGVDTEHANATFKSGVLEVHLPKTGESKTKQIEIRTS